MTDNWTVGMGFGVLFTQRKNHISMKPICSINHSSGIVPSPSLRGDQAHVTVEASGYQMMRRLAFMPSQAKEPTLQGQDRAQSGRAQPGLALQGSRN